MNLSRSQSIIQSQGSSLKKKMTNIGKQNTNKGSGKKEFIDSIKEEIDNENKHDIDKEFDSANFYEKSETVFV